MQIGVMSRGFIFYYKLNYALKYFLDYLFLNCFSKFLLKTKEKTTILTMLVIKPKNKGGYSVPILILTIHTVKPKIMEATAPIELARFQ